MGTLENEAGHRYEILDCSHVFCEACIASWKSQDQSCPNCRQSLTSEEETTEEAVTQSTESYDHDTQYEIAFDTAQERLIEMIYRSMDEVRRQTWGRGRYAFVHIFIQDEIDDILDNFITYIRELDDRPVTRDTRPPSPEF